MEGGFHHIQGMSPPPVPRSESQGPGGRDHPMGVPPPPPPRSSRPKLQAEALQIMPVSSSQVEQPSSTSSLQHGLQAASSLSLEAAASSSSLQAASSLSLQAVSNLGLKVASSPSLEAQKLPQHASEQAGGERYEGQQASSAQRDGQHLGLISANLSQLDGKQQGQHGHLNLRSGDLGHALLQLLEREHAREGLKQSRMQGPAGGTPTPLLQSPIPKVGTRRGLRIPDPDPSPDPDPDVPYANPTPNPNPSLDPY